MLSYWGELLFSLVITVVVYLIVPVYYRINCGKVSKKRGNKIALINSIVCCVLFCVVRAIISGGHTIVTSFAPAFLYYIIARLILIDPTIKDPEKPEKQSNECINVEEVELQWNGITWVKEDGTALQNQQKIDKKHEQKEGISPTAKEYQEKKTYIIIKRLQICVIIVIALLVLFAIIFPLSLPTNATITSAGNVKLSNIDANQTVYYEGGNYNYVYVKSKNDGRIYKYSFYNNGSRYTSYGTEIVGYATSSEIKTYFGNNLIYGKPPLSWTASWVLPVGLIIPLIMLIVIILLLIFIHKKAEEEIFKLQKVNKSFKKIKNDYKNENINRSEYKRLLKQTFSKNIMRNGGLNKMFVLFY